MFTVYALLNHTEDIMPEVTGVVSFLNDRSAFQTGEKYRRLLGMRVVLASGSARRRELLRLIFDEYEVIASKADEDIGIYPPQELVLRLSEIKASEVFKRIEHEKNEGIKSCANGADIENDALKACEELLVIGSDTVVALKDRILGKPADKAEAYDMLKALSGGEHRVYTGVTLISRAADGEVRRKSFCEETVVHISKMSDEEIRDYVDTGEPMDKAGAYGIQTEFAKFVTGIEGDYNNVVGLPVARLYQELRLIKDKY